MVVKERLEHVINGWVRLPYWVKAVLLMAAGVPWLLCLPVGLFGSTHQFGASIGGSGGIISGVWTTRFRQRQYWDLDSSTRRIVSATIRSGVPSI